MHRRAGAIADRLVGRPLNAERLAGYALLALEHLASPPDENTAAGVAGSLVVLIIYC